MGKCYLNESFWPIPFGLRNKLYYLQLFVLNVQCLRYVPGSNWHCYCNNCPICLKTLVYDIIFYKPITMNMALTSPVRWRNIDIMVEVLTLFWKNIPNLFELAWSLKNGDVFVSCSEMVWSKVPEEMAKEVGTEKFLETSWRSSCHLLHQLFFLSRMTHFPVNYSLIQL